MVGLPEGYEIGVNKSLDYSERVEVPMRPWIPVLVALFLVAPPPLAQAQNSAFCRGFSEGWKTVKGRTQHRGDLSDRTNYSDRQHTVS